MYGRSGLPACHPTKNNFDLSFTEGRRPGDHMQELFCLVQGSGLAKEQEEGDLHGPLPAVSVAHTYSVPKELLKSYLKSRTLLLSIVLLTSIPLPAYQQLPTTTVSTNSLTI